MRAAPSGPVRRRADPLPSLTETFRSRAAGVGSAIRTIRTARGSVLRAARANKWRFDSKKWRAMLSHLQADLQRLQADIQTTQHEVEAEVGEFIQSPHLLFAPIRMVATLALPMAIPLCFMPSKVLLLYGLFVFVWYLLCSLFFATEVAMRPPWYKRGLPSKELPPYWKGFVHDPRVDLGVEFEDVEFPSCTGALLRGWFIPSGEASSQKMVVFVHGVGRDRRTFLRHAADFLAQGYSCLLFDFSEHGLSDGADNEMARGTLFGAREQYDVIAAAEYLKTVRGASQIAFVGTSCGASSAILAAAERPDLVSCVVAENPFTRADDLLRHHLNTLSKNYLSQNSHQTVRRAVFWLAGKVLMIRMGYYFRSYGAIDAVRRLQCPLLVAHSTEDDVVPFKHGLAIYEAAANAKTGMEGMASFFRCSDAAHCALYDKDPEMWTATVLPFVGNAFERLAPVASKAAVRRVTVPTE